MSHSIHMPSIQIDTSSTTSNYPFFCQTREEDFPLCMVIRYFRLMIIGLRKLVCVAFGHN